MLKKIRSVRLDLRTSIILLVLALLAWAFIIYANIQEFVPEELRAPDTLSRLP